jgi:hypothetical protein
MPHRHGPEADRQTVAGSQDNPLRDDPLQCRRPFKTQQTFGKPSMPVVNVWEAPAGLQTKAGVRSIADHPTGRPVTALTEVGRLGTTF